MAAQEASEDHLLLKVLKAQEAVMAQKDLKDLKVAMAEPKQKLRLRRQLKVKLQLRVKLLQRLATLLPSESTAAVRLWH